MSVICKMCGSSLHDGTLFCMDCGSKTDAAVNTNVNHCICCGSTLKDNAIFCTTCGMKIGTGSLTDIETNILTEANPEDVKKLIEVVKVKPVPISSSKKWLDSYSIRCPNCGFFCAVDVKVCPKCSTPIESHSDFDSQNAFNEKTAILKNVQPQIFEEKTVNIHKVDKEKEVPSFVFENTVEMHEIPSPSTKHVSQKHLEQTAEMKEIPHVDKPNTEKSSKPKSSSKNVLKIGLMIIIPVILVVVCAIGYFAFFHKADLSEEPVEDEQVEEYNNNNNSEPPVEEYENPENPEEEPVYEENNGVEIPEGFDENIVNV